MATTETLRSLVLERLVFEATHVVVSEGEKIYGVVEVTESWIGDLASDRSSSGPRAHVRGLSSDTE